MQALVLYSLIYPHPSLKSITDTLSTLGILHHYKLSCSGEKSENFVLFYKVSKFNTVFVMFQYNNISLGVHSSFKYIV